MPSNSKGSYRTTPKNMMAAFDKLPATARAALANAAFNYAPQPILTNWRRGTTGMKTGEQIAKVIAGWDATKIAKDAKRVWGISDAAISAVR